MSKYIDAEQFKRDNGRLLHCDFPYLSEETLEELIDNMPAADIPRWIPVTERLPEAYGRYLVTLEDEDYRSVIPLYYGRINRKDVFYDSDSEYGDVHYDDVIAWMELPEPYKGGEEE